MDYAQYVNRRPPSPPSIPFKGKSFPTSPTISTFDNTSLMSIPLSIPSSTSRSRSFSPHRNQSNILSSSQSSDRPTAAEVHAANAVTDAIVHNRHTIQYTTSNPNQFLSLPIHNSSSSNLNYDSNFDTTLVSTFLHRRAICGEYTALAELIASSITPITLRERHQLLRIRLEDMLTHADQRSIRVLNLALAKCDSRLDSLSETQRLVDDARSRMRVIESKHFQGARSALQVPNNLRRLHLKREGVITLVQHIRCTLFDQVRIHYLLSVLSSRLSDLRNLLSSLDRNDRGPIRSPSFGRSNKNTIPFNPHNPDRPDTVKLKISNSKTQQRTMQPRCNSYGYGPRLSDSNTHRRPNTNPNTNPNSVSQFGSYAELTRKSSFPRRVHRSPASPITPSPRQHSATHQRSPSRRADGGFIPMVVRRALSYNSSSSPSEHTRGTTSTSDPSEASWWGSEDQSFSPVSTSTTSPVTVVKQERIANSEPRLSLHVFRARSFRRRGKRGVEPMPMNDRGEESKTSSGSLSRDSSLPLPFPFRRSELDSADGDSFPVSPMSGSSVPSDHSPGRNESKRLLDRVMEMSAGLGDQSVMHDIESLCTEASSVLSSSRGMDNNKNGNRRGSISGHKFHRSGELRKSGSQSGLSRLRFGRIRTPTQVKKMWAEINELYGIILIHAPHLLEERIVSRASKESGLLGPWNARKGHSSSIRSGFHNSVVIEATRKVDGIINWQRRLIVAIRRDYFEQQKILTQADNVISNEYLRHLKTRERN